MYGRKLASLQISLENPNKSEIIKKKIQQIVKIDWKGIVDISPCVVFATFDKPNFIKIFGYFHHCLKQNSCGWAQTRKKVFILILNLQIYRDLRLVFTVIMDIKFFLICIKRNFRKKKFIFQLLLCTYKFQ